MAKARTVRITRTRARRGTVSRGNGDGRYLPNRRTRFASSRALAVSGSRALRERALSSVLMSGRPYGVAGLTCVPYAMDRNLMASVVSEAVSVLVRESMPDQSVSGEVEAVLGLCMLGVHRTGSEDPRRMAAAVSGKLLEHLVRNVKRMRAVPAMGMAAQFLVLEWCFRNGHLEEDWRWEWEGTDGGKIHFRARIPLESIAIPSA